ncbi:MAG: hypothetical protein ACE5F1_09255 [Planctomycetota bacterium]
MPPAFAFAGRVVASLVLAAAALVAQRTWIVGNPPGVDFWALQTAVDTAQSGDTIIVRSRIGGFKAPTISKPLTLIGEGRPLIVSHSGRRGRITTVIHDTQDAEPGAVFTMRGFGFESFTLPVKNRPLPFTYLTLSNLEWRVHLEDLRALPPPPNGSDRARVFGIDIRDCRNVIAKNIHAGLGISVLRSKLTISSGTATGHLFYKGLKGPPWPTPGVQAIGSDLTLAGMVCISGGTPYGACGLSATSSTVRVQHPGTYDNGVCGDAKSSLAIDPRVVGSPRFFGKVITRRMPTLLAARSSGPAVDVTIHSSSGHVFALFSGPLGRPWQFPSLGEVWLDPRTFHLVAIGIQNVKSSTTVALRLPRPGLLRGLPLGFQAMSGTTASLSLTNPLLVVLD